LLLLALAACERDEVLWEVARPEDHGLDARSFRAFTESVQQRGTEGLLIVLNDEVIHEWYAAGRSAEDHHYTASMQKGVTGGLGLALALQAGGIGLDEVAANFVEAWRGRPLTQEITIRHLATHSSGMEDSGLPGVPNQELTGWRGTFWRRDSLWNPPMLSINEPRIQFSPGTRLQYSNPGFAVLSYVLAEALREADGADLRTALATRIFGPIGLDESDWSMGYGRPINVDGTEVWGTWGGGSATPRALARIGRLMLRLGDWDGQRILSEDLVEKLVSYNGTPPSIPDSADALPAPGLGWWSNANGVWTGLPRDAFAAAGAEHQVLLVIPSHNLILVRLGGDLRQANDEGFWEALARYVMDPLAEVLIGPSPGGWSETVGGVWFEPMSTIQCEAVGSDNWPITWAEDGALFASFGDGWGFDPGTDEKLSLGLVKIPGPPTAMGGRNVRAPSAEQVGDGTAGGKASGILDVRGTLYMWVRNMDNARLAWSDDNGRTWQWGFRFEDSFGSPTFLQYGPGYEGARDAYVYIYSQDGPSAYEPDEQLILARVHRDSITTRDAYEFFAGFNHLHQTRWSPEIGERVGVFEHDVGVQRSEVAYNEDLERYILALGLNYEGAWGLFDAPHPWGPWTTIMVTPRWDVGETHSYRIPTKWIQRGGRDFHLVFSGFDRPGRVADGFCIRKGRLVPGMTPLP
jgi:CubicO group peptidase (beta-lactamase class C family)